MKVNIEDIFVPSEISKYATNEYMSLNLLENNNNRLEETVHNIVSSQINLNILKKSIMVKYILYNKTLDRKDRYIQNKKTSPLLSTIVFIDDNGPAEFILNETYNDYTNKDNNPKKETKIVVIYPKKNKSITFKGDYYNNVIINEGGGVRLRIDIWENMGSAADYSTLFQNNIDSRKGHIFYYETDRLADEIINRILSNYDYKNNIYQILTELDVQRDNCKDVCLLQRNKESHIIKNNLICDNFMTSYIQEFPDAIPVELCKDFIELYEMNRNIQTYGDTLSGRNKSVRNVKQIYINNVPQPARKQYTDFLYKQLAKYLQEYRKNISDIGCEISNKLHIEGFGLNKYEKNNGYYTQHNDFAIDYKNKKHRVLTYLIYLNNVSEGGETVFFNDKYKIKPEVGKLIIFPASWCFPHKANIPISDDKYIITEWFWEGDITNKK